MLYSHFSVNDIINYINKKNRIGRKPYFYKLSRFEGIDIDESINSLQPNQLNYKQRLAYDYVKGWLDLKIDEKRVVPLYLNISGRAGCGKSA